MQAVVGVYQLARVHVHSGAYSSSCVHANMLGGQLVVGSYRTTLRTRRGIGQGTLAMTQCGRGWLCLWAVLSVCVGSVVGQQPCGSSFITTIVTADASTATQTLPCNVPNDLRLTQASFAWQWEKLRANLSVERQLPLTMATQELSSSIYTLQSVDCKTTGIYEARYLENTLNQIPLCRYSCRFIVEVQEDRQHSLVGGFSMFTNITGADVPATPPDSTQPTFLPEGSSNVLVSAHVCTSGKIELESGCVVTVNASWYKDGYLLQNISEFNDLYSLSPSGELRIQHLTSESAGYYTCLTTLPYALGTYLTAETLILVFVPEPTPTPSPSLPPTIPTEDRGEGGLILGILRVWEVGLIVANIGAVVLLVICVGGCMVYFTVGRRSRRRRRRRRKGLPSDHVHQKLEGTELETVDFGGPAEIPFSSVFFEELLHKGTFKVVHHATITHPPLGLVNVHVAVKRLKDEKSELGTEELMTEAYTLRAIHEKAGPHPNVVSLLGMTTQGGPTCLFLEYLPHGTLDRFLWSLKKGPVPPWYLYFVKDTLRGVYHKHVSGDLMSILMQVAEGMRFLTEHGFIHRDLSTRNILVGDRLQVKIGNPGMYQEGYYYVVTEREHFLHEVAPECIWEKRYSMWSDVWSYGILSYKVVTLETNPYPGVDAGELYTLIVNGHRPQLLASFSNQLYFLLQRCWQFVATERPTFAVIANELKDLAEKPTRHITLKSSRDEFTPGYVSENGQVFIHAVPLQGQNVRLSRRSGTQHSLISSIDDTIYSRETAETMIYVQSEMETEDYSGEEFDEEATAEWVNMRGRDGRRARLPNGVLRNKRVRISDESEENGNNHGISSNGALSTPEDSDRQASNQSESEDESHDGSQDRLVRF